MPGEALLDPTGIWFVTTFVLAPLQSDCGIGFCWDGLNTLDKIEITESDSGFDVRVCGTDDQACKSSFDFSSQILIAEQRFDSTPTTVDALDFLISADVCFRRVSRTSPGEFRGRVSGSMIIGGSHINTGRASTIVDLVLEEDPRFCSGDCLLNSCNCGGCEPIFPCTFSASVDFKLAPPNVECL